MNADDISVISLPDVSSNGHLEEKKEAKPNSREDMKVSYWKLMSSKPLIIEKIGNKPLK